MCVLTFRSHSPNISSLLFCINIKPVQVKANSISQIYSKYRIGWLNQILYSCQRLEGPQFSNSVYVCRSDSLCHIFTILQRVPCSLASTCFINQLYLHTCVLYRYDNIFYRYYRLGDFNEIEKPTPPKLNLSYKAG